MDSLVSAEWLAGHLHDRGLQLAENITPPVRRGCHRRLRPAPACRAQQVSAVLDTGALRALDARAELAGQDPRLVASSWLRAHGLMQKGGVVH